MGHFSISEAILFVRGTLPADVGAKLVRHLAECESCRETFRFASRVSAIAERDRPAKPPAWVFERARQIMRQRTQEAFAPVRTALLNLAKVDFAPVPVSIPDLIFDSWSGFAAATVRGSAGLDRHLVFRDASLRIAVHIESFGPEGRISIAGQLQPESPGQGSVADTLVVLVNGSEVIHHCKTDQRGEWVFPEAAVPCDLWIACSGRAIKIPRESLAQPNTV